MDFYLRHSALTDPGPYKSMFDGLPADVAALSTIIRGVLVHRDETEWLFGFALPAERRDEANIRYASAILERLGSLDERPAEQRFAGTCRDFALLLCAMLRSTGVPARLRAGFGGYFTPGFFDDHWVVEYWTDGQGWRLADAQVGGLAREPYRISFDPADVPRDGFVVGGRAWLDCRAGLRDPAHFGVSVANLTGMWEVQGNVVRDLAALNRVETLPWDDWGLIPRHYDTITDDDKALLDRAARLSADGGPLDEARELYASDDRLHVSPAVGVPAAG